MTIKIFWNINILENQLLDQIEAILESDKLINIYVMPKIINWDEFGSHALSSHQRFHLIKNGISLPNRIYLTMLFLHLLCNSYDLIDTKMAQSDNSYITWLVWKFKNSKYMVNLYGTERDILKSDIEIEFKKRVSHVLKSSVFHLCNDKTLVEVSRQYPPSGARGFGSDLLYNGVKLERFERIRQLKNKTHEDRLTIFYNHRLMKFKRPEVFIEALSILNKKGLDFLVLIVGPKKLGTPLGDKIQMMISEGGLSEKITWIDRRVSGTEMDGLYVKSNLTVNISELVVPSLSSLEGLASGIPLIASNELDSELYVNHGVSGFIVEPFPESLAEKLEYFIHNPSELDNFGRESFLIAENNFSLRHWAKRYVDIYRKVLTKETRLD